MQGIAFHACGVMRFLNSLFRFYARQGLDIRRAFDVRDEHDLGGAVVGEEEDLLEHFHYKIHRRDIVVVDDDAVERLKVCFDILDDLDLGEDLLSHFNLSTVRFRFLIIRSLLLQNFPECALDSQTWEL